MSLGCFRIASPAFSFLEEDRRSISDQVGDSDCVPVCHAHAPVRCGMTDLPRFRRAMYPVVRYVDSHPDNTHRIVWTRCDLHLGICLIAVPEDRKSVV